MALPITDIKKLHQSLEYNFLYNKDLNSMHLLLQMLENEVKLKKFKPKYSCIKSINRSISRTLHYREDKNYIIRTIGKLINDDINRLELSTYLDGYSTGFKDDYFANMVEELALTSLGREGFYNGDVLFHQINSEKELEVFKLIEKTIQEDKEFTDRLKSVTITYVNKVIKTKIFTINNFLDKQIKINLDNGRIDRGSEFLTIPEISNIYQKIIFSFLRSLMKTYITSYWYGVNDRVLSRY